MIFGTLMLVTQARSILKGWVDEFYVQPAFHFRYYGFEWIPVPGQTGVHVLFLLSLIGALGIALGLRYHFSAVLFFLSFTYIELLDVTYYLNHYYFISLVSFLIIFIPLNRLWSVDALLKPALRSGVIHRHFLQAIRISVGGVYFMAGVAKLNAPWLLEALPLKMWLPPHNHLPLIGSMMNELWVAYAFSWCGALFDLSVPFLLYHRRSRPYAFIAVILFHSITAILFPIGMFPFMMMFMVLVFFEEDELLRFIRIRPIADSGKTAVKPNLVSYMCCALVGICLFILPFRYALYPSGLFWHEQGYRFSWRVMLMEKAGQTFFFVKDPLQPGRVAIDNLDYLTNAQEKQMSTQPDLILQFAHYLEKEFRRQGIDDPEVYVESWVTINGTGSRLFIDPTLDLTTIKDGWQHRTWVLPSDSIVTPDKYYARVQ